MEELSKDRKIPLLDIENLQIEYEGIPIVKNLSLSLKKGEIFGIVGESGCGKSTLLGAILKTLSLEGRMTAGTITFEGQDLSLLKKEEMRRLRGTRLGAVFQNPWETLNPSRRIKTQFYEALRAHKKVTKEEASKIAVDMMSKLNLENGEAILEKYPFQLSGGMNQRVALALAMIMSPSLLLADEPTSALDVTVQAQAVREMMDMRDKFDTAILIVTHNMGVVSYMADRIAVMYAGRMVECGTKEDVLKHPVHPYTISLLSAVPDFSGKMPKGLDGMPPSFGSIKKGCEFADRCFFAKQPCRERDPELLQVAGDHYAVCDRGGIQQDE